MASVRPTLRPRDLARRGAQIAREHAAPLLIAVAIAFTYYLLDLRGGDLAAHLYRAELFRQHGLFIWNYNWYGGHYLVSYGVMFPGMSALIGVRLAGMVAYVAAVVLFAELARRAWPGTGGRAAAIVFAVAFSAALIIAQLPFALGIAFGLGAMLAAMTDRMWLVIFLAVNCALTSPLAALFVAFVAGVVWLEMRTPHYLAVAVSTLAPALVVSVLFPEGGSQPFLLGSYLGALAFCAFFWFAVRGELEGAGRRALNIGFALYLVFLTANEIVHSPVGGNAIRLGMIVFPVIAAAILWPRAGRYALVVIIPLAGWQYGPAIWAMSRIDQSTSPKYFADLNHWLDRADPARHSTVEIVFTRNHFEAAYVADQRPIARGWERQLDIKYNPIFYNDTLDARNYHSWLVDNNVRWVAVPSNTQFDYSARREAVLVTQGQPYLKQVASMPNWKVYDVTGPRPSVAQPRFAGNGTSTFQIQPRGYGLTVTGVRWQRFWRPSAGCAERTNDDHLALVVPPPAGPEYPASRPPAVTFTTDFSIGRLVGGGASCAEGYTADGQPKPRGSA